MDFSHCKDEKQAKEVYRKLAKTYHPDAGGSNEKMQQLTKNYDACLERLKLGSAPGFQGNPSDSSFRSRQSGGWQQWAKTNDSRAHGYFYGNGADGREHTWSYSEMKEGERVEDPLKNEFYTNDNQKNKDELIKELKLSVMRHLSGLGAAKEEANKWHKAFLKSQQDYASMSSHANYMKQNTDRLEATAEKLQMENIALKTALELERKSRIKSEGCHNRLKTKFNKFKEKFIPKTESLT